MAAMSRKLVSVVTGTYQRHELLFEAIDNVRGQTYPNIEHVIVSDGPDQPLREVMRAFPRATRPKFAELGRHWSSFLAESVSAVPFQVAQWLASGDLLVWLADDEWMAPDHIESLVDLLEATDSDFVYSRAELWFNPELGDFPSRIVGTDPPRWGQVANALYRAELLDYRGFEPHVGSGTDWDQVKHWMAAGARWAMLDRVTFRHRVDKLDEGPDMRMERQPLRGQRQRVAS
jgi:glycosyltransferase involved in cell wall biosynthesis